MYTYHVFAVLVFILIRRYIRQLDRIIVDIEYPGKDNLLRDLIAEKMRVIYPEFDSSIIVFQQVGKGSMAHDQAYYTYVKKYKPSITVSAKDILATFVLP